MAQAVQRFSIPLYPGVTTSDTWIRACSDIKTVYVAKARYELSLYLPKTDQLGPSLINCH